MLMIPGRVRERLLRRGAALLPALPDGTLSGAARPPRRLLWAAALTALRPWLLAIL